MILLILAIIVGIGTGLAISALAKDKNPLQIFGASVAIAIGLYLVLIVANIWSFFWFYNFAHDQLLNVSWSLDPYLVRALSYILAAAYFSLAPTVIVAIATFKNKNFALWFSAACAGTCILLFLLSVASSHKRFFDESGNPMARYYRDPDTNCIELFFNKEIRVHPTYNTELKWVTPDVVRDWERQQELQKKYGGYLSSCIAPTTSNVQPEPTNAAVKAPKSTSPHHFEDTTNQPSTALVSQLSKPRILTLPAGGKSELIPSPSNTRAMVTGGQIVIVSVYSDGHECARASEGPESVQFLGVCPNGAVVGFYVENKKVGEINIVSYYFAPL